MGLQIAVVAQDMMRKMGINPQIGMNFEMPKEIQARRAAEAARDAMKEECPHLQIGLTLSLFDLQPQDGEEAKAEELWDADFAHYLPFIREDDSHRIEYIRRAVAGVKDCVEDGIPVLGYLHWSLLDNFEWQEGFAKTFGLIAVDRTTQERHPKESLKYLGEMGKEFAD